MYFALMPSAVLAPHNARAKSMPASAAHYAPFPPLKFT